MQSDGNSEEGCRELIAPNKLRHINNRKELQTKSSRTIKMIVLKNLCCLYSKRFFLEKLSTIYTIDIKFNSQLVKSY